MLFSVPLSLREREARRRMDPRRPYHGQARFPLAERKGYFTFNNTLFAACSVFLPSRFESTTNGCSIGFTNGSA